MDETREHFTKKNTQNAATARKNTALNAVRANLMNSTIKMAALHGFEP
jgi:hypothetical protein